MFLKNNIWSYVQCLSNNERSLLVKHEDKGPNISEKKNILKNYRYFLRCCLHYHFAFNLPMFSLSDWYNSPSLSSFYFSQPLSSSKSMDSTYKVTKHFFFLMIQSLNFIYSFSFWTTYLLCSISKTKNCFCMFSFPFSHSFRVYSFLGLWFPLIDNQQLFALCKYPSCF